MHPVLSHFSLLILKIRNYCILRLGYFNLHEDLCKVKEMYESRQRF